jgi:hypothetical protein
MAHPDSRIAEARLRAARVKRTAVAVAVAGFLAIVLLAREGHPATAGSTSGSSTPASSGTSSTGGDSFDFGSGSVVPSDGSDSGFGTQSSVS